MNAFSTRVEWAASASFSTERMPPGTTSPSKSTARVSARSTSTGKKCPQEPSYQPLTRPLARETTLVVAPASISFFRSEEHTSELQSLMRTSYAVFCLKNTNQKTHAHLSATQVNTDDVP